MKKYQESLKKFIVYTVILSLNLSDLCYAADIAVDPESTHQTTVIEVNSTPVINIAKPNENGLSHNQYLDFNIGANGLILNNNAANTAYNSQLAGLINQNPNLNGSSASIILNEITGNHISNLQGMLEIAGTKANVIIANPNGIMGNGFGFINADRATLVTGTPNIVNGNLESFTVAGGNVTIAGQGTGNHLDADGRQMYEPVSKLDILTRAANINAEIWAKDEINVVTGTNQIDYDDLTAKPLTSEGDKPAIALDIAAVGGMYANKIKLIGTEKGLGYHIGGDVHSGQSLYINNEGKIAFIKNQNEITNAEGEQEKSITTIDSEGTIDIHSKDEITNNTMILARDQFTMNADKDISNSGILQAGAPYQEDEEDDESPQLANQADLMITSGENITTIGTMEASRNVKLKGKTVTYNEFNVQGVNVEVIETEPKTPEPGHELEPKPKPDPEKNIVEITQPDLPDLSAISTPIKPAETVEVPKVDNLPLTADTSASVLYRPILDTAPNGIPLVQIAEVNQNGVSRNLYTDFNINQQGLILNNATKYELTQLGGYIDRNDRLAGNGARIILNEVTTTKPTSLNGFLEVAGNRASVVIANPNGITVNGFGCINTANATLASANVMNWQNGNITFAVPRNYFTVEGQGINAGANTNLSIIGDNLNVNQSEIWANKIQLSADGRITNTGKISANDDVEIKAENLLNHENGFITAQKDIQVEVKEDVNQNQASLNATGNLTIYATNLANQANSMMSSGKDMSLSLNNAIENNQSTIKSDQDIDVHTKFMVNKAGALQSANKDLTIKSDKINNSQSAILANQAMTITASELKNQTNGYIASDGNLEIDAKNVTNQTATIKTKADLSLVGDMVDNKTHALIYADGSSDYTLQNSLTNTESAISSKENLNLKAANITNQSQAMLESGKNLTLLAQQTVINDAAAMTSAAKTEIAAQNIYNRNQSGIYADGLKLTAKEDIQNTDSLLVSNQDATLAAKNISNTEDAVLFANGDIHLTAEQNILNQSSDIESKKDITIQAQQLTNEKKVFETDWDVTNQIISYRIPHWGGDYYNAIRTFNRNIHTGVIKAETAEGNILADGNIDIQSNVVNHYSKIVAGQDLNISGDRVENYGYQGTIVIADRGNDVQYWRYKHHGKHHIHCHMVYGSTTIPYSYDEIQEEPIARLGILGGNNKVTIQANTIDNKTYNAGKEEITYKTTEKNPLNISSVTLTDGTTKLKLNADIIKLTQGQNAVNQMQDLVLNTKIFTINEDPSAKYLIETNEKFANYQKFLSSDYLLNRVKSDPAKVAKRLGDGYYEQTLVTEQITNLTGRKYLSGYTSDLEQYKALMENGAVAAEKLNLTIGIALTPEQVAALTSDMVWLVETEVNGQTVLVPQIYLASIKAQDLTKDGALITGGEIELYAKDTLTNIGTIQADKTTLIKAGNLTNQTGQIKGQDINLEIDDTFANLSGNVAAKDNIKITAKDIINQTQTKETNYRELNQTELSETATITAQTGNVELIATNDIKNQSGKLSAGKDLSLSAGNNVEMTAVAKEKHVAVVYDKSSAQIDEINHLQSQLNAENINIQAGKDIKLNAVTAKAQQNITTTAGNNIEITAAKDLSVFDVDDGEKGIHYTRDRIVDETVKGGNLDAGQNIQITAGQDVSIKGSQITSEQGKTKIQAQNDVTIENETEYHEKLHEEHRTKVGVLATTTTKIYDYQNINQVKESYVNGNEVEIQTGKDTNITASIVAADKEINVKAGENININSANETSQSEYKKEVKKSGIFGSGGLGFTIGSQKQKDSYDNQAVEQVGSTIGSIGGNVTLESGKDVDIKASEVIAGSGINITAENVTIENGDNDYNAQEKHEFKQSGLTVSLESSTLNTYKGVVNSIDRATKVEDDRLKALYVYKAKRDYDEIKEKQKVETAQQEKQAEQAEKDKQNQAKQGTEVNDQTQTTNNNPTATGEQANEAKKPPEKSDLSINISLGTSKSESQSQSHTTLAQASTISAGENVNIKATAGDIKVKGSEITGENITLEAKGNLDIQASTNKNTSNTDSKSSSASIGVSINLGDGSIGAIGVSASKATEKIKENAETYNQSTITAKDTLTTKSGQDTNIIGSKLEGETIKMEVGKDLNIESLQEKETYDEKNKSASISISAGSINGSASQGKTNSNYESVTDQAGIYAGEGGFDIEVGKNTDLKGAVIASEADASKNKLSTDTLTYSDLENKADYSASSTGYSTQAGSKLPVTPNVNMPVSGDASSTTKSAISNGTIEVRSNPIQDLSQLNRDTENALNALGKIFDKETVKEKQELANLFGQEAYKAVGDLAEKQWEKATTKEEKAKWAEGGEYKILLHTLVGGIVSELGGNGFTSGAVGAGVNQALQKQLANIKDPNLRLIASSLVGATASKLVGGNGKVGGSTAYTGILYNDYVHRPTTEGAIVYSSGDENGEGRGYYKVNSDGDEEYLNNGVEPGDVFWVADGKYINGQQMGNEWIVGDDGSPIAFSWTPVQIPVGGTLYNDYITVDIAVNQETGKDVVINGRTVMSPDSTTRYNDAVAEHEESMTVPEIIAGFVNPGYRATFFAANAGLEGKVVVHHAIEQQVLKRFPGLFTEAELNSLSNLRGIPKEINSEVHLSAIRKEWNNFYKQIDQGVIEPTKEAFYKKAKEIDEMFGNLYNPPH